MKRVKMILQGQSRMNNGRQKLVYFLNINGLVESVSAVKRLIKQNAIKINGVIVEDFEHEINCHDEMLIRIGNRIVYEKTRTK